MVRTRKVETSEILDAAERVVVRHGAVGLSIDAVAKEAGISKTRVVYDFKSKSALVEAVLDRQMALEDERRKQQVAACANTPHPQLFARLKLAERVPDELDKAVAMMITASMSTTSCTHARMQACVQEDMAAMKTGERPRAAHMAHLALIGFCCHEWFGLHTWTPAERTAALADIAQIYKSFPDNSAAHH